MVGRPRLLDLFCGAGGATRGYQMAGFHVTGVDIDPQPRYCGDRFIQSDALTIALEGYDVIHASPPCQAYSPLNARWGRRHTLDLVAPVRARLLGAGVPFVIENVPGAPLRNYTVLCGTMFGLRSLRHRWFEVWPRPLMAPRSCCHAVRTGRHKRAAEYRPDRFISVTGRVRRAEAAAALGIDWMVVSELSQAIPPAYTEWIGVQVRQMMEEWKGPAAGG